MPAPRDRQSERVNPRASSAPNHPTESDRAIAEDPQALLDNLGMMFASPSEIVSALAAARAQAAYTQYELAQTARRTAILHDIGVYSPPWLS
jgi:hypothetical protein